VDAAAEAWDRFEAEHSAQRQQQLEQLRVDRMRVKGYAIACLKHAEQASKDVDEASVALARARKAADNRLRVMKLSLERAEQAARVVAADDPEWTAEVAQCLEECFG